MSVAMIWGASGGIGRALLQQLVDAKWTVVALSRHTAGLDDLEGSAFLSDIAAMRHETLTTRIFAT